MPDTSTPTQATGLCGNCHELALFTCNGPQYVHESDPVPAFVLWTCQSCGSTLTGRHIRWQHPAPETCPDCGTALEGLRCPACNWQVYLPFNGSFVETPAPADPEATLARLHRELARVAGKATTEPVGALSSVEIGHSALSLARIPPGVDEPL